MLVLEVSSNQAVIQQLLDVNWFISDAQTNLDQNFHLLFNCVVQTQYIYVVVIILAWTKMVNVST